MITYEKSIEYLQKKINMNTVMNQTLELIDQPQKSESLGSNICFKIVTENEYTQKNPASKERKEKLSKEASDLSELFKKSISEKDAISLEDIEWVDDKTVKLSGDASTNIHSFVLLAEALGKDITYTKQTIIKISDNH